MATGAQKPVIFLAFANELVGSDQHLRNLSEEARRLRTILSDAERDGLCELVERANVTSADIFDVFQNSECRHRITIFHFGGHAHGYGLMLESASGGVKSAGAAGLAEFLGQQDGLELVFLNGCSTQPQAQGLLDANVSMVIATSQRIKDEVASDFAVRFYKGLAVGASIETAYKEAKAAGSASAAGEPRSLYIGEVSADHVADDRWPWDIYVRPGADIATGWNLPDAVDDPLFCLPFVPQGDLPDRPYRHLYWFERKHAEVFFGRGHEIRDLYTRLISTDSAPIILFYGQSGVGKSSLLAAGLVPRLEQTCDVQYLRREQTLGLTGTLRKALNADETHNLASTWSKLESEADKPLVIILDQAEEIYTRPNADQSNELRDFLDGLQAIFVDRSVRPQGKLILSFRKEWLAEIKQQVIEKKLAHDEVFLDSLDRRGLIKAIRGPTLVERLQRKYALRIDDNLPGIIADNLLEDRESPLAPTLQILLSKMWDEAKARAHNKPVFDTSLYQDLKKQGLLLGDFVDQQFTTLEMEMPELVRSGLALDVMAFHTTPLGSAEIRPHDELTATYSHQTDTVTTLIPELKDRYLITAVPGDRTDAGAGTRLAHDTLAPLIRERFDESDRPGQRARRILESRVVEWQQGSSGTPLDEADLKVAESGRLGMRAWTDDERRLLDASRTARALEARTKQTWRVLGALAIAAILVFGGLSYWLKTEADKSAIEAQRQTEEAQNQSERAALNAYNARLMNAKGIVPIDSNRALVYLEDPSAFPLNLRDFAWGYYHRLADRQRLSLNYVESVNSVAFSPDGKTVASSSDDGTIQVWDASNGEHRLTLEGHTDIIWSIAFSPDGKTIASGSADHTIRLWDTDTGHTRATLTGHDDHVNSVTFSPNGELLASGGDDSTILLWDANSGEIRARLNGHTSRVASVAFSPDSTSLASGSYDLTIRVWDLDSIETRATLIGHTSPVGSVAFSPDGEFLASGSGPNSIRELTDFFRLSLENKTLEYGSGDETIRLWDIDALEGRTIFDGDGSTVNTVAFSPDGETLASASADGAIRLWDTNAGMVRAILTGHTDEVNSVAFSPDGKTLASGGLDNSIRLWHADIDEIPATFSGHKNTVNSVVFFPDGRTLVSGSQDDTIRLWDVDSGDIRTTFTMHTDSTIGINSVAVSPNGKTVASGSFDNTIRLWDIASGETRAILTEHTDYVTSVQFSPDGKTLASGSEDNTIRLWDADSGEPRSILAGHTEGIWSVDFSPDGKTLASGSRDNTIRLWDAGTGETRATLTGHTGPVRAVAFSPDGKTIASGSDDNNIRLWDVNTGETRDTLTGHASRVRSVAFSPDGRTLVSGSDDAAVHLWDVVNGEIRATLTGHANAVMSVAFSPDGKILASGSHDKTILLWDANSE